MVCRASSFTLFAFLMLGTAAAAAEVSATRIGKAVCTQEGISTYGVNRCRVAIEVGITDADGHADSADIVCEAVFSYHSRRFPEGTTKSEEASGSIKLDGGIGNGKLYATWKDLLDAASDVKVETAACRIAGQKLRPREEPRPALIPPPHPPVPLTPSPDASDDAAQPLTTPPAGTELELLKEQNRARELEIRMLELKIKLREMERDSR